MTDEVAAVLAHLLSEEPTHLLSKEAVRWSIDTLGSQRLHPTFPMYLYLRVQKRAGKLETASASSNELESLISMPGNPDKPYYFPLIDRGKRTGKPLASFWRAENISGSWSPRSISRQDRGSWLSANSSTYALPDEHAALAPEHMLYNQPVSALALGAYFLRNDGFLLSGTPQGEDVIAGFRARFDYPDVSDEEFSTLYSTDVPGVGFDWFISAESLPQTAEERANV